MDKNLHKLTWRLDFLLYIKDSAGSAIKNNYFTVTQAINGVGFVDIFTDQIHSEDDYQIQ